MLAVVMEGYGVGRVTTRTTNLFNELNTIESVAFRAMGVSFPQNTSRRKLATASRVTCPAARLSMADTRFSRITASCGARKQSTLSQAPELRSWREPVSQYSKRNLALAYLNVGVQKHLPAWIVRGYRMLTEMQTNLPDDPQVLSGFGTALMEGKKPCEAEFAFDRLLLLDPRNAVNQENAGRADLGCGDISLAVSRLETAVELDPLLLSAAEVLQATYRKTGDTRKQAALTARIGAAMQGPATPPSIARKSP